MTDELLTLFRRDLPDAVRSDETARLVLSDPENRVFTHTADGRTIGACVVQQNAIVLLCVDAPYRRRGIGSRLLAQAEQDVRARGFADIVAGAGKDYLVPGVPIGQGAEVFFQRHGYAHAWGDCECVDMSLLLPHVDDSAPALGAVQGGVTYRWANKSDAPAVLACVADAEEDFVPYYQPLAEEALDAEPCVLIAETDGLIVGALLVERETDTIGSVGCTVTRPAYRGRGVATTLVRLGTRVLGQRGFARAFVGYTYTGVLGVYGRAGYTVCARYMMAKKRLSQ